MTNSMSAKTPDVEKINRVWSLICITLKMFWGSKEEGYLKIYTHTQTHT